MILVNVGCGGVHHPDWVNLDLVSTHRDVRASDLRRGLPFGDRSVDAVYSSHVLEHLTAEEGRALLTESFRVLRPGGVVRVVVPDLEAICRAYLAALGRCLEGIPGADQDHAWMRLELYDQMVRCSSGGQMGAYLRQHRLPNETFVRGRIGAVYSEIRDGARRPSPLSSKVRKAAERARQSIGGGLLWLVGGHAYREAFREGRFRQSGEIHRHMYDRFSLTAMLGQVGFDAARVETATTSRIPGFAGYELDTIEGQVRKADSLFVEAVRPAEGA